MRIYLSTACVLQCLGDYTYLQGKVAEFWLQRSFHEKDALRLASASGTARLPFEVLVAWWQSLPVMSQDTQLVRVKAGLRLWLPGPD